MGVSALLERRAHGLSSADALRLEEHLQRCPHCVQDSAQLDELRELAERLPQALPQLGRERAIEAALAQSHAVRSAHAWGMRSTPAAQLEARGMPGRPALWAGGLALSVAAAVMLGVLRPWSSSPSAGSSQANASTGQAGGGDRVLLGAVEIDGQPSGDGALLTARATLHARKPATVALAHARVALAAGTTLRWDGAARQVVLDHGSVTADVDPSAHQPFSVQTARFMVRVLGTRFTVDQAGVSVERGKVAVFGPDGGVRIAELTAGQRFEVDAPSAAPEAAEAALAVEEAVDGTSGDADVGGPRSERTSPRARGLLGQARALLAAGDARSARSTLEDALALSLATRDRAEALSLRAECALVAGDLRGAIAGYLRVNRSYRNLPAGQNALFAAARLQAERGRDAAAVKLLRRYLARHPRGRFVQEARQRLVELDRRSPAQAPEQHRPTP